MSHAKQSDTALRNTALAVLFLPSVVAAQTPNALLDFRFNPYARPPRAEFRFQRPPLVSQYAVWEGRDRVLVLECPTTHNRATRSNYYRPFPEPYALKALDISERENEQNTTLVVRLVLRQDIRPLVENPPSEPYLYVTFADYTATAEPASPATGRTTSSAVSREHPSPTKTPTFSPIRFVTTMLLIAGGILVFVSAAVGAGLLLVWGRARFQDYRRRQRASPPPKVFNTSREMKRRLEHFRASVGETVEEATTRHRSVIGTIREDMSTIRETLSSLIAEFERATQSIVLLQEPPTTTSKPSEFASLDDLYDQVKEPLGPRSVQETPQEETTVAASATISTGGAGRSPEERQRFVRDWVGRAASRFEEEDLDGTQAEAVAQRMNHAASAVLQDRAEHLPAPADTLSPIGEPRVSEAAPQTDEENPYERARRALADGSTPHEIAQRTGLSLGEIELITQLERMRGARKSQSS